jgi:hypothetical protein
MKPLVGILMAGVCVACGPIGAPAVAQQLRADAGSDACALDVDCPDGMVCAGCDDGSPRQCVPGCREDQQCGVDRVCVRSVLCTQCPCPPGWCDLDPCLDADGDGYIPNPDLSISCPGKLRGDCDDSNSSVFPGAREQCHNWVDDDCNGKRDGADPACQAQCDPGVYTCNGPWDCYGAGEQTCDRGCCIACPSLTPPACTPGQCLLGGGLDPQTGCSLPLVCGDCSSCPTTVALICATNGSTYNNACLMEAAQGTEAHDGGCVRGEGLSCNGYVVGTRGPCAWGQYCRDTCPGKALCLVEDLRCTDVGVCEQDQDCPAGNSPSLCDGGVASEHCVDHACVASCP